MKAVMISIQPKWCELIANGEKTIEVRKTRPNIETPFKCYIYCTKLRHEAIMQNSKGIDLCYCDNFETAICFGGEIANGKVIGSFVCDRVEKIECCSEQFNMITKDACMTLKDIMEYCNGKDLYTWHISDLKIYDAPKELSEFSKLCEYAPFSKCYPKNCLECSWIRITRPPRSWQYCEKLEESKNE